MNRSKMFNTKSGLSKSLRRIYKHVSNRRRSRKLRKVSFGAHSVKEHDVEILGLKKAPGIINRPKSEKRFGQSVVQKIKHGPLTSIDAYNMVSYYMPIIKEEFEKFDWSGKNAAYAIESFEKGLVNYIKGEEFKERHIYRGEPMLKRVIYQKRDEVRDIIRNARLNNVFDQVDLEEEVAETILGGYQK